MRLSAVHRGLIAAVLAASLASAAAAESRSIVPVITPARPGTECIADPATMRRDHPQMLKHQRDATVHGGIRGAKASLKDCVSCHAGPTTASVASQPADFCVSCHSYAAVKIDCFECHATQPALAVSKTPRNTAAAVAPVKP